LLQRVPLAAAQSLETEGAAVLLLEPDGRRVRMAGAFGLVPAPGAGGDQPFEPDAEARHVLGSGEALVVADYAQEQRFAVPPARLRAGLYSALAVPLQDRGRTVGLLSTHSRRPGRFGDDELHFLTSLANLLVSSLQRALTEEALLHAQRLESVGQLTGGIAHDFNNLLTIIHGNLQVLEDLPALAADDYARQLVAAALRASRRGAELTGKLLAFSRRQVLQPREVDVGQLLASLADMLRRTLDQRIAIELDAAPCRPVLADPGQLESALLNIAINARDAMPEGGRLRFACHVQAGLPPRSAREPEVGEAAACYVAIAVSDTGVGMTESVRDRAFEPFFTTKASGRGTGLGLSTVYGFVTQSRGAVQLDSAPGEGTTVTLYIPCAVAAFANATAVAQSASDTLPTDLRVLLVEDDAEVREVVRSFLQSMGCRVTALASGEQALALVPGAQAFELLLSDVALGAGMRGTELARQAQTRWPGLAVVLMSGYASDLLVVQDDVQRSWPLLRKPCSREELAQAVAQALQRR
jgi:signal transduction histidine kinase/CheY-like chemotaxis protein